MTSTCCHCLHVAHAQVECSRSHGVFVSANSQEQPGVHHAPAFPPLSGPVQDASVTKRDNIIMYTTIPVGTVVLLAAFAALAALTGCFGAKSAAAKRSAALTPVKGGAYGQSGPIPISVTATAGR